MHTYGKMEEGLASTAVSIALVVSSRTLPRRNLVRNVPLASIRQLRAKLAQQTVCHVALASTATCKDTGARNHMAVAGVHQAHTRRSRLLPTRAHVANVSWASTIASIIYYQEYIRTVLNAKRENTQTRRDRIGASHVCKAHTSRKGDTQRVHGALRGRTVPPRAKFPLTRACCVPGYH